MIRDRIKDFNYFDVFIEEDSQRIDKFTSKLNNGEVKEERIFPVKTKIHDLKLGVLIAKYSQGESLEILKSEYMNLVEEWENVFEPEFYNKNLKMISLAVLFNVNTNILASIKKMLKKDNINDWLLEFLLDSSYQNTVDIKTELLFPDSFSGLKKAVYDESPVEKLKAYLSKEWYNEDCGCYEAHKSAQNIYYGYWSLEAGAISKILKLDDEELKGQQYYPYDLVHFKG